MLRYKQRITNIRQAEDPNKFVIESTQIILPNEVKYQQIMKDYKSWYNREPMILEVINRLYKLYYELAKDNFLTDEQADEETEDFLNCKHLLRWKLSVILYNLKLFPDKGSFWSLAIIIDQPV